MPETREEAFNLKNLTIKLEIEAMERLQDTILDDAYRDGIKVTANAFADYFFNNSKGCLTREEALKKSEHIISEYQKILLTALKTSSEKGWITKNIKRPPQMDFKGRLVRNI